MLEQELHLERGLFFFLNGSHSSFGDDFFYICTYPWTWLIFYLCFLWVFTYKKNWKEIVCVLLAVGLLILFCDQISSHFFKIVFHRFRPTHHPDFEHFVKIFSWMDKKGNLHEYKGGLYGFISGHATNTFGLATFFALIFKNKFFTWTIFLYAALISYSRIYLGVHFISDVVVGAFVGIIIAIFIYQLYNWGRRRWLLIDSGQLKKSIYSVRETYFLCGIFYLYLFVMLIFNSQLITILLQK